MEKFKTGYFYSLKVEEQYTGGLMATGRQAIPIASNYTEPLQPTRIPAAVETLDHTVDMDLKIHPMDFSVSTAVDGIESSIQTRIVEVVDEKVEEPVKGLALFEDLETGKSIW